MCPIDTSGLLTALASATHLRAISRRDKMPEGSGPCVNSLHTVWDVCIIEKKLGTDPPTVARDLMESITESDRAARVAIPVEGWAPTQSRSCPATSRENPRTSHIATKY